MYCLFTEETERQVSLKVMGRPHLQPEKHHWSPLPSPPQCPQSPITVAVVPTLMVKLSFCLGQTFFPAGGRLH